LWSRPNENLGKFSVPITVLLYDGPLLCGFNVAIKGLIFVVFSLSYFSCLSYIYTLVTGRQLNRPVPFWQPAILLHFGLLSFYYGNIVVAVVVVVSLLSLSSIATCASTGTHV